jgi:hypothetical protein
MRRILSTTFTVALLLGLAPAAHAQLDAAQQHFATARFEEALDALDALDASTLEPADVELGLELRVRVLHALGDDEAALERALVRLAELSPEHRFPDEVPPDLVLAFDRARAHATTRDAPSPAPEPGDAPWYLAAEETEADEGSSPVPWIILGAGLVAAAITAVVLVFALQPSRDGEPMEDVWELPPGFEEEL